MQIGAASNSGVINSVIDARAHNAATTARVHGIDRPVERTPPVGEASNHLDLDAFMAAWGSTDPEWDVHSNGLGDGGDLGLVLTAIHQTTNNSEQPSLLDAWGAEDSDWDFNGDDMVDEADLGMHLNFGIPQSQESTAPGDPVKAEEFTTDPRGNEVRPGDPIDGIIRTRAAQALANPSTLDSPPRQAVGHVREVLGSLGHEQSLPGNLADALSRIAFKQTSAEAVLHQLRQELPGGGIEVTA